MTRSVHTFAAEFVIVVVGVLVALAADSAMDGFRERDARRYALEALRRDVTADLESLESFFLPLLLEQEEARDLLAAFLRNDAPIADSVRFTKAVSVLSTYLTFDANTAAIEELKGMGDLHLLSNDTVRARVLAYYNDIEDVAELDDVHRADVVGLHAAERLVGGLALPMALDLRWRAPLADSLRTDAERALRAEAAHALRADQMRSQGILREFLVARSLGQLIQFNTYHRLQAEGAALVSLLDETLDGG